MARAYVVPSDSRDVARDIVATLRDIVRFATDKNVTRLPGIASRASALAPLVESIATATPCAACAARHSDGCAMRTPPVTSRDAAIDAMVARVDAMVGLPSEYRAHIVTGETATIDAMYACTCNVDRAPRATSRATGRAPLTIVPNDGAGDTVHISVDNRDMPTTFHMSYRDAQTTIALPSDRNDHAAITLVTAEIMDWVTAQPDTTPGQRNAATKKLRSYGFYTTANGYAEWLGNQR